MCRQQDNNLTYWLFTAIQLYQCWTTPWIRTTLAAVAAWYRRNVWCKMKLMHPLSGLTRSRGPGRHSAVQYAVLHLTDALSLELPTPFRIMQFPRPFVIMRLPTASAPAVDGSSMLLPANRFKLSPGAHSKGDVSGVYVLVASSSEPHLDASNVTSHAT